MRNNTGGGQFRQASGVRQNKHRSGSSGVLDSLSQYMYRQDGGLRFAYDCQEAGI